MHRTAGHIIAFVCLLLIAPSATAKDADQRAAAEALLQKARELGDIRPPGGPPFRLTARFRLLNTKQGQVDGKYELHWVSDQVWKEEFKVRADSEVRVGAPGKYYRSRTWQYLPNGLGQIAVALRYRPPVLRQDQKIRLVERKSGDRIRLQCVEIKDAYRGSPPLACVATDSGALQQAWDAEYRDFAPFGEKLFPRTILISTGGRWIAEARIETLDFLPGPPPTLQPQRGWEELPGCFDPRPPHLIQRESPKYPRAAMERRLRGEVYFSVFIDPEGNVVTPLMTYASHPLFEEGSIPAALKRWRYEPATCDGTAVPYDGYITVRFWTE